MTTITNFFRYKNSGKEVSFRLRKAYREHPEYPRFVAMLDALSNLPINNNVQKIAPHQLHHLQGNFVADMTLEKGNQFVFCERTGNKISYETPEGEHFVVDEQEFKNRWSGLVIDLEEPQANYWNALRQVFDIAG